MAIRATYNFQGVTIPAAYIRLDVVTWGKVLTKEGRQARGKAQFSVWASPDAPTPFDHTALFDFAADDPSTIAEGAYDALKALYPDAEDA